MPEITRKIGLSLGADICWPICYEELVRRLNPALSLGDDTVRFAVERVTIEPFGLRQPCPYDVVLDRLTHWYHPSREWIKKAVLMDDLYVLNNPWSIQSMEKQTSYCAMMRLGLPVPETWMLPPKSYEPSADLESTLRQYARLFDVGTIGNELGYPLFMKPYDGGAWVGVQKIDDESQLKERYEESAKKLMHLQSAVNPFDLFVRAIGVGPQVRLVRYDAGAPLHARYEVAHGFVDAEEAALLTDMTLTINSFFGWDFNSCETMRSGDVFYPIDFANACPDSQVTSLHYHFPWLIKALLRWSLFCAATQRPMHRCLDWDPYYEAADRDLSYREKLAAYAAIARRRLDADRFEEFCVEHLGAMDEVVSDFFATDVARDAVRQKVMALFPEHEIDEFTDYFWDKIQQWRADEGAEASS